MPEVPARSHRHGSLTLPSPTNFPDEARVYSDIVRGEDPAFIGRTDTALDCSSSIAVNFYGSSSDTNGECRR